MPAIGQPEQVSVTWTLADGVTPFDPDGAIKLSYGALNGPRTTAVYGTDPSLTRVSAGIYKYIIPSTHSQGTWQYRWEGYDAGGAQVVATEGFFIVTAAGFDSPVYYPAYATLSDVYSRMYAGRDGLGAPDNTRRDDYVSQLILETSRVFDEVTYRNPGAYAPMFDVRLYSGRGATLIEVDDFVAVSRIEMNRSPGAQVQYGALASQLSIGTQYTTIALDGPLNRNVGVGTQLQIGLQPMTVALAASLGSSSLTIAPYTVTATLPVGTPVVSNGWTDYSTEMQSTQISPLPMRFWPKRQLFRQQAWFVDPFRNGNVRLSGLFGVVQPDISAPVPLGLGYQGLTDAQLVALQPIQPATGTPAGWWVTPPPVTEAVAIWTVYKIKAGEAEYADLRAIPGQAAAAGVAKRQLFKQAIPAEIKHIVDKYSNTNLKLALIGTDGTDPRDEQMQFGSVGGYRWASWQSYDPRTGS